MKHADYDVIIVGGGHAGVEAASAAARAGASTVLVTLKTETIGVMSCNPAIGGLGKGHLVREIDALDGIMARCADASGIQFRLLNRRKGPAVQGPRAQIDRALYRRQIQETLARMQGLTIVEGSVDDLLIETGSVAGVILADDSKIRARAVVLTTGTFLRGVIHVGDQSHSAGRWGERAAQRLADRLADLNLPLGRLKTGTPPRLSGRSIDWERLEMQPADADPVFFSFFTRHAAQRQVGCGITHTNSATHDIIRDNLHRSAMYGGHIDGIGPRYCPSIEDKVVRFADKDSHQIFLEPEGLDDDTVYPNGISTSLPPEVQETFLHSIAGLERARILQQGYAIEYDYVDPRSLSNSLELLDFPSLFLAGQINGTTGYEEAAAQGLVAGLNAARRAVGAESVTFSRTNSYIGVLIDDLTSRGVSEPYRMFTSRAEFRLSLRADNADQRLTPQGLAAAIVGSERSAMFDAKMEALEAAKAILTRESWSSHQARNVGLPVSDDGERRTALQFLSFPSVALTDLVPLVPEITGFSRDIARQIEREAIYANYLVRQEADVLSLTRDEEQGIPQAFDYTALAGLSTELKIKLATIRPSNLAQASRIDGMTPAALLLLLGALRRGGIKGAA